MLEWWFLFLVFLSWLLLNCFLNLVSFRHSCLRFPCCCLLVFTWFKRRCGMFFSFWKDTAWGFSETQLLHIDILQNCFLFFFFFLLKLLLLFSQITGLLVRDWRNVRRELLGTPTRHREPDRSLTRRCGPTHLGVLMRAVVFVQVCRWKKRLYVCCGFTC